MYYGRSKISTSVLSQDLNRSSCSNFHARTLGLRRIYSPASHTSFAPLFNAVALNDVTSFLPRTPTGQHCRSQYDIEEMRNMTGQVVANANFLTLKLMKPQDSMTIALANRSRPDGSLRRR